MIRPTGLPPTTGLPPIIETFLVRASSEAERRAILLWWVTPGMTAGEARAAVGLPPASTVDDGSAGASSRGDG